MTFWASDEQTPPATEDLTLDFGSVRPVNFCDFEIGLKPISVEITYWDGAAWQPVVLRTDTHSVLDFTYDSSVTNPWTYGEAHFELVTTDKIKLEFTRQITAFPFEDSILFPWSIEIRNLRLVHIVIDANDFVEDSGVDILGNPYSTTLFTYSEDRVADSSSTTYWQSQPNPSRFAVESLYFDLRVHPEEDLPVVIDEIYLEPLTPGVIMHIYTSNDSNELDWDLKLWTPVPRHYLLAQGNYALPISTSCRFVKLEFTQLTPMPYNTLNYPTPPPITYRKHPTWVMTEITQLFPNPSPNDSFNNPFDLVSIDPISLGFQTPIDGLDSSLVTVGYSPKITLDPQDDVSQIAQFIGSTTESSNAKNDQQIVESQIRFNSPEMFQDDLVRQLEFTTALNRSLLNSISITDENTNPFNKEDPLVDLPLPDTQSVLDVSAAAIEKTMPITWFPRICRHQYQIISSPRPSQVAYFVAIKNVTFLRRSYGQTPYDLPSYVELLQDDDNLEYNDLTADPAAPWRYT